MMQQCKHQHFHFIF